MGLPNTPNSIFEHPRKPMIAQVRPADFAAWLQAVRQSNPLDAPLVLDVREPHELALANLGRGDGQGFRVIAMPMGSVPARLTELDPDQPIACLCHHGVRSMQVARFLASNGFEQVVNIDGGIDAWSMDNDSSIARY
jgi:rhodanese-related sulfurtransferase